MPEDSSLYLPILVGAVNNWKSGIDYQRDDEGENISSKNPFFNELTAMYWAWKNLEDTEYVGMVQYRRVFTDNKKQLANRENFEEMLADCDVLLPKKRKYYIETNYSHYIHAHHKEPLNVTKQVISVLYPTYEDSFNKVMRRRSAHMFNMFVMKKTFFDDYSTWLFGILSEVEKQVDISTYSVQEKRVFGYISELLMDVWIDKNELDYKKLNWTILGPKHTFKKILFMILRKLRIGGEKTHF